MRGKLRKWIQNMFDENDDVSSELVNHIFGMPGRTEESIYELFSIKKYRGLEKNARDRRYIINYKQTQTGAQVSL